MRTSAALPALLPALLLAALLPAALFPAAAAAAETLRERACNAEAPADNDDAVAVELLRVEAPDLARRLRTSKAIWRPSYSRHTVVLSVTVNGSQFTGDAYLGFDSVRLSAADAVPDGASDCMSSSGTVSRGVRRGAEYFFSVGTTAEAEPWAVDDGVVPLRLALTLDNGANVTVTPDPVPMACGCPDPDDCAACGGGCATECAAGAGRPAPALRCLSVEADWACVDCAAGRFQPVEGTPNATCLACTSNCNTPGQWADRSTCGGSTDATCRDCTQCEPWEAETSACSATSDRTCTNTPERLAMLALRDVVRDFDAWGSETFHCDWEGVTCNENGQVLTINTQDLEPEEPGGRLPETLRSLAALRHLKLDDIGLSGPIPSFLSTMTMLQTIDLQNNPMLTGRVPASLLTLTRLETLNLDNTGLSGPLFEGAASARALPALQSVSLLDTALQGSLALLEGVTPANFTLGREPGNDYLFVCDAVFERLLGSVTYTCTECGVPPLIANAHEQGKENILYPAPAMDVGDAAAYQCSEGFFAPTIDEAEMFQMECIGDLGASRENLWTWHGRDGWPLHHDELAQARMAMMGMASR